MERPSSGRQLRLLAAAGITEVVVTTGPHVEQLRGVAAEFPALEVSFVANEVYDKTNYIYSMHLARELLDDDVLRCSTGIWSSTGARWTASSPTRAPISAP
ncbi:MAG: hypothetical protein QM802_00010 [Agriterribacter sp.]